MRLSTAEPARARGAAELAAARLASRSSWRKRTARLALASEEGASRGDPSQPRRDAADADDDTARQGARRPHCARTAGEPSRARPRVSSPPIPPSTPLQAPAAGAPPRTPRTGARYPAGGRASLTYTLASDTDISPDQRDLDLRPFERRLRLKRQRDSLNTTLQSLPMRRPARRVVPDHLIRGHDWWSPVCVGVQSWRWGGMSCAVW